MISKGCIAENTGTGNCEGLKEGRFCSKHKNQYVNGIIDAKGNKIRSFKRKAI